MLHGLVELLYPGSFQMPSGFSLSGDPGDEYAFIYYSFVTLTTLGYGDITPLSAFARTFAWMEAVVGQLFLAVLVARMVGLRLLEAGDKGEEDR